MRHHSQRVKRKNYRDFSGAPLYHRIIQTLLAVPALAHIVIDTDSPFIMEDAAQHFPSVQLLERPEHLRADTLSMNDVLLNTTTQLDYDFYLQTHSTNPLLKAQTIDAAIQTFTDMYPAYDSLFSVTRIQTRLWSHLALPINHNPDILLPTQDLPPIYEENSCFYIFHRDNLRQNYNRIGKRPHLFELARLEAIDIDEMSDFELAETLYISQRKQDS